MRPIFSEYAADDQSDGAVDSMDSMNSTELVSYGRELGLVGGPPALSERAIKTLFAFCQQEEEEVEEGEAETQSDSEQVYSEFMETNAAIGSQMKPDPYNVLEMRLDQYLNEMVHPIAAKLPRFKQAMLKTPERLKVLWLERCQRLKEKEEAEAETVWWGLKWNECEILFFFVRYSIYILSFIFLFGWIFVPLEGQAAANHRD